MVYRSTDAGETGREVVRVTHRTRLVDGVRVRVVRDRAYVGGELVEDTRDWYAQDRRGNVWYFGENTKTLRNGKVTSTKGSWAAGRNGASAGIVMEAHPKVGDTYSQEDAPGVAEDRGEGAEPRRRSDRAVRIVHRAAEDQGLQPAGARRRGAQVLPARRRLDTLEPIAVIAGHKNPQAADDPSQIEETRDYLTHARQLLTSSARAEAFYDGMLAMHPHRINPGALWGAAMTLFPQG